MSSQDRTIEVLHVDDDQEFVDMAAAFMERHDDRLAVESVTSVEGGMNVLHRNSVDCVVSDYEMPGTDGIEFLEAVREAHPDLPFILYTGRGSEDIASEAISAGVTDYLQKESGTSHYEVLVNRITNAVEQRRAQAEALETEQRLQTIAENANDILWTFTPNWDDVLFVNSPYEEIWGRSIEELRAEPTSFLKGIHPDDRPRVEDAMDKLTAGESVDLEYRVNEAEDYQRWVWVQGAPVETEGGEVEKVVGFARDITARKTREEELAETKDSYKRLIDTSPMPIWVQGFDEVYYANDAAADLHGAERADALIGESPLSYVPEEELERARRRNRRLLSESDTVENFTGTFHRRDGTDRIAEITASPITYEGERSIVVVARDVTEERMRERELERYERLVEVSGDPMYMLDAEGTFTYVNEAFVETSGYARTSLLGAAGEIVMPDDQAARIEGLIRSLLSAGERQGTVEMELSTSQGTRIPVENQLSLLYDDGEFDGTVGVLRDITDRRRREQSLERERDRLEQFAGVVSHDLKNPLTVAQGRVELAMEQHESEQLSVAREALDRMERLIDDVLTLARAGQSVGDTECIDVGALADSCWQTLATDSATLNAEASITVEADRSRLQQLLENLLANAVEHGGPDVVITVGDLSDGFYVADDGPGLPAERRAPIFDPGYTEGEEGAGFGLSIVRDVAEAHGWSVGVTESPDGGAQFEIRGVQTD